MKQVDLHEHCRYMNTCMMTANYDLQDRFVNSQLETVKYVTSDTQGNAIKIYMKFDDSKQDWKKMNADAFAKKYFWVPVEKTEIDNKIKPNETSSTVIKRTWFPLMLAWACIVHKVGFESKTLKRRSCKYGLIYVALRGVTTSEELYICGSFFSKSN